MGNFMINYSVYMMTSVMNPEAGAKAYAKNQVNEIWSLEKFAKHIASHNGVFSRGTVKGVLSDMCECLVEQLLNGNKIQLGELGTFGISISCDPAESLEKFTSKNIKAVNILFAPGEDFENLLHRAEFNPVASRAAQAATLKAEKGNEKTVDLEAAKKKPSAGDNNGGDKPSPTTPSPTTPPSPSNPSGSATDGKKTLKVNMLPPQAGSVNGEGAYDAGSSVTVEAIPAAGFKFMHWEDNATSPSRVVKLDDDVTLTAYFSEDSDGAGSEAGSEKNPDTENGNENGDAGTDI